MAEKGYRNRIRDMAAEVLQERGEPLHHSAIASIVLTRLGLVGQVTAKTVNTSLHDDPLGRFERVGAGTWTLKARRT